MTHIKQFCKWRAWLLIFLIPACTSHIKIPDSVQRQINAEINGKIFWLKQSLYAGPFYDDNRYQLLHSRPFEELKYLKTPDGDYILPPPAKEIIPTGTKVVIEKIEWPTKMTMFKRPLLTPRQWPWVYLRLARDRGPVTVYCDKSFIFILPAHVINEKSFHAWQNNFFSKDNTNDWLLSLDASIRTGILTKKPVVGMDSGALLAALGEPDQIKRELVSQESKKITKETATYGPIIVILENGRITKFENVSSK